MDVTQYDPQAVANAEAQVQHEMDKWEDSRRAAVDRLRLAKAQCIADDVVSGTAQWPERVEEYRYLRDLPWDGGQPPAEASTGREFPVGVPTFRERGI